MTKPNLNPCQIEILRRISFGETAPSIAHGLKISVKSVNSATARIYDKLGVVNGAAAVRRAFVLGIFDVKAEAKVDARTNACDCMDCSINGEPTH